jgi:hypothetical protein
VNLSSILIMVMAAGTLSAQDASALDARIPVFVERYRPAEIVVAQTPGQTRDQPAWQNGVGVRFLGEIASAPGFYYELGGMLDGSSKFSLNGTLPDGSTLNLSDVKVADSYWSLGAAYLAKIGTNGSLGLHLEGRGEALSIQGQVTSNLLTAPAALSSSTTYLRPWVRASADYTFSHIGTSAHPYLGVDGSVALVKTSQTQVPDFTNMDTRTLRALAPKFAFAVYGGLRF